MQNFYCKYINSSFVLTFQVLCFHQDIVFMFQMNKLLSSIKYCQWHSLDIYLCFYWSYFCSLPHCKYLINTRDPQVVSVIRVLLIVKSITTNPKAYQIYNNFPVLHTKLNSNQNKTYSLKSQNIDHYFIFFCSQCICNLQQKNLFK